MNKQTAFGLPLNLSPLPHKPLVSVLIGNYNHGAFVGKAIDSVLKQTYQNFEVIVCDDGSTDNSPEILGKYADLDSRIKIITKTNGGQASALNTAYSISQGDVVAFLDSDDEWYPTRLDKSIQALRLDSQVGIVGHPLKAIRNDGLVIRPVYPLHQDEGWRAFDVLVGLHLRFAATSGITLRKEIANIVFPLPEEFRISADRLIRERSALVTKMHAIREVLADYRLHGANAIGLTGPKTLEQIKRTLQFERSILESHRTFAKSIGHSQIYDLEIMIKNSSGSIICAEALLDGRRLSYRDIDSLCRNNRKMVFFWKLLHSLPSAVSINLYRLWRSDALVTRIIRKIFSPSGW